MTANNVIAFDIETVPDVEFGRRLHGLEGLTDKQVGYVMQTRQREQTGTEFLSLEQHRVVAISVAVRTRDGFEARSLGEPDSGEAELVRRFFAAIDHDTPTLVSWNGSGFDLPVLHYRALRHSVQAERYWEMGDEWQHVDLMDVLAGFQERGRVGLDKLAQLLGLPGKSGLSSERVWDAYLEGRIDDIRRCGEADAIKTYLIYLRFELMRGSLTHEEHERECALVASWLDKPGAG